MKALHHVKNSALILVLTLLITAPVTAQNYSDECEQLRDRQEEMRDKIEGVENTEERREIMQNYRSKTRGLAEGCSESIETGDNLEQQEPEASEGYAVPDYNVELTESQFRSLRERMVENITEAERNPSEHFPECVEEGKEQITNYRENISETDSMEGVIELNKKFREKRDDLKENCGEEKGTTETSQNNTEHGSNSLQGELSVKVDIPQPGEEVTRQQVSEIRNKFKDMNQQIQDLQERNRKIDQRIQELEGNNSEPANNSIEQDKRAETNKTQSETNEEKEEPDSNKQGNGGGLINRVRKFFLG